MKKLSAIHNGKEYSVQFDELRGNRVAFLLDGEPIEAGITELGRDSFLVETGNRVYRVSIGTGKNEFHINGKPVALNLVEEGRSLAGRDYGAGKSAKLIAASMPGKVVKVYVKEKTPVKKGDQLLVLEAMKMENEIKSPADGVIGKVFVEEGEVVEGGDKLIEFDE